MTYDIEREKQKTEEIRKAFRECFPLAPENDLPFAASHIKDFLRRRIEREVEEAVFHFQSRVVRILCEVSPPKTHIEDMARIVVNQAKELPSAVKLIDEQKLKLRQKNEQLGWLQATLHALPQLAEQFGFEKNWVDLGQAIDKARTALDHQ